METCEEAPGRIHILHGNASAWRTDLAASSCVRYRDLYRGIDLVYRMEAGGMKAEFLVAAGAAPSSIRMLYSHARSVAVDASGDLVIATPRGEYREKAPYAYQESGGVRQTVPAGYRVSKGAPATFEIGAYDASEPLVIDPEISFSTYFGGSGFDGANAIAVDAAGNIYIAGWTESSDLPTAAPLQPANGGGGDAFVAKLDPSGARLLYCTYLGGNAEDRALGIALDGAGNAYIAGWTSSTDFPVTASLQTHSGGGRDAFVAKIDAGGNLVYSTFLGGNGQDSGTGIAVDASGNAYISGSTNSTNFPVYRAVQSSNGGQQDAFVAGVNSIGTALVFSTYLGGAVDESANAIAVDSAGNLYIAGDSNSSNFPTLNALQPARGGNQDAFVAKLNPATASLAYSTYLGGTGGTAGLPESALAIDVDSAGSAFVAGVTSSPDFPVSHALQSSLKGVVDAFVAQLSPEGTALAYSTYLGGSSAEVATAVRADSGGKACVAGYTASTDFPASSPVQAANAGSYDAFISCFAAGGGNLTFSTYFGGALSDAAYGLALRGSSINLIGQTLSGNLPLQNPVQSTNGGGFGAMVAKLASAHPPSVMSATPASGSGASQTFTLRFADAGADVAAVQVLINASFSDYQACHLVYNTASNAVHLLNDAGTAYSAGLTPGGAGALQNSQCQLDLAASSAVGFGTTAATLTLALSFQPSFAGARTFLVYASDRAGQNSDWVAPIIWTVPATTHRPSIVSGTPASGSGASQTFTLRFADAGADVAAVQVLINASFSDYQACHLVYNTASNAVHLLNDAGTAYSAGLTPGGAGALQNSQCQLDLAASSAVGFGTTAATLTLALSFQPSFAGARTFLVYASDRAGQNSDWVAPIIWTIPGI
jgi:hypothetical protein